MGLCRCSRDRERGDRGPDIRHAGRVGRPRRRCAQGAPHAARLVRRRPRVVSAGRARARARRRSRTATTSSGKARSRRRSTASPSWAQAYWKWKSAKSFFGDPLMTIEVDTTQQLLDDPRRPATRRISNPAGKRPRRSRPRRQAASGSTNRLCSDATSSASSSTSRFFPATRSRGRRNRCNSSRSDLRPAV